MKEPRRLVDESPGGFEAELIRAGRREGPSAVVRRASAAAGGLMAAGAALPKASAATGLALKALLTFGVQGMVAGTLVTGAVVGASHYLEVHGPARGTEGAATREQDGHGARTRSASRVVPPSANVGVSRLTTIDEPKAPLDGAPDEEVTRPDAFRAVQVGARKAAPSVTFVPDEMPRVAPTARTRDRFTDEIRAFERAQSALNRSDVGGARAALDTYDRTFPRGALALEAEVLRIEILGAEGDRPALRARARAFLDKNPSVPEARRIQNLLERSEEHTE